MYETYKTFRNRIAKLAIKPSLHAIWHYQRNVDLNTGVLKLRTDVLGRARDVYVWELHTLCREIVLHARGSEQPLSTLDGLTQFVDHLRKLNDEIAKLEIADGASNLAQGILHRTIHQQLRWQHTRDEARLFRAWHVYSDPTLSKLLERSTGVSVRAMYLLAIAIAGAGIKQPGTLATQDYFAFDVRDAQRDAFFKICGTSAERLREALKAVQKHDTRWALTFNPLEATPLINIDRSRPSEYWCPFPHLLLRRATEGLFYDLVNGKNQSQIDFGHEYGHAFERYVGRVLENAFDTGRFNISGEQPYVVDGQQRHGVDWIVSDDTANLFIECKTRRLPQNAKETGDGDEYDKPLDEMAKDIVKLYLNINDAVKGASKWVPNGLPVYPMIVTYEDWYLMWPMAFDRLLEFVKRRLEAKHLPTSWVEAMPFFFTSIAELEIAGQDINHLGIERYCSAAKLRPNRHFQLSALAHEEFPDVTKLRRRLLENSWHEIFPNMKAWSEGAGLPDGWPMP